MADEACRAMTMPPTHLFLQGSVGGLAAAVAACHRQYRGDAAPRVVVVEPDLAPCLMASARTGSATSVAVTSKTMMAALSSAEPSERALDILTDEASDYMTTPTALSAPPCGYAPARSAATQRSKAASPAKQFFA